MQILAVIPARSGSKSVIDKNIRLINGKPMLAYSVEHARSSRYINRVIVSTDSARYAAIAEQYGAEVPFLRPAEYATDTALDIDVFYHALTFLRDSQDYMPDLVVQLRPTYPIRNPADIDAMIEIIRQDETIDSVRSIAPAKEIPYKMWTQGADGRLKPICPEIPECYNMPRQELPTAYYQNACIDIVRSRVILEQHSMSGKNIHGYVMSDNYDIDNQEELIHAANCIGIKSGKRIFCFDIDGVIAITADTTDYAKSIPNPEVIKLVNRLYDMGNKIVLNTARGYTTGVDWSAVTRKQMQDWGVKYHELKLGKPNADFYIDDHAMTLNMLFGLKNLL